MLKYALLGFLNYNRQTGYSLKQLMDRSIREFWTAKQSQVYTTLKKMEAEGEVRSTLEPQSGRPDRRTYQITEKGVADLEHWLNQPITELPDVKHTLLLKLFFSGNVDKNHVLTQLRLARDLYQQKADLLEHDSRKKVLEAYKSGVCSKRDRKDHILWEAARQCGVLLAKAWVQWLDETIRTVEENF